MKRYETVDAYIEHAENWRDELIQLRQILNATALQEEVKWGAPCYTFNGKNLVGMGAFKSYLALWFFQGALLTDPKEVLVNAQEGKTKALRQWRFKSKRDIDDQLIVAYVEEAISLQERGLEIKPQRHQPVAIPTRLKAALSKNEQLSTAFNALSEGKRREYADYIAEAKRDETKVKRLEKIIPMIIAGQGLHDKYRHG